MHGSWHALWALASMIATQAGRRRDREKELRTSSKRPDRSDKGKPGYRIKCCGCKESLGPYHCSEGTARNLLANQCDTRLCGTEVRLEDGSITQCGCLVHQRCQCEPGCPHHTGRRAEYDDMPGVIDADRRCTKEDA